MAKKRAVASDRPAWSNVSKRLGDVTPWEGNPKTISRDQARRLLASWDELGQFETIAIGPDPDCALYDGHQRFFTLRAAYGDDLVVDMRQSSRPLTEEERRKLVVLAHVGTTGSFDWDKLSAWDVDDLKGWGLSSAALDNWTRDARQLSAMLSADRAQSEIDPDDVATPPAKALARKWKTKTGQVWELGDHRLACGDSTDLSVLDAVLAGERATYGLQDPPYGISVVGHFGSVGAGKPFGSGSIGGARSVPVGSYEAIVGDEEDFDPAPILKVARYSILFGANYYADRLPPMKGWVVWDKKGRDDWRDSFSDCELAWSNLPIVTRIYHHTWMGMVQEGEREKRVHPTQKPTALYERLIRDLFTEPGLVIDCYLGSGTTLLACERVGRACRAIEIDPGYVAVALERWSIMTRRDPKLAR